MYMYMYNYSIHKAKFTYTNTVKSGYSQWKGNMRLLGDVHLIENVILALPTSSLHDHVSDFSDQG